MKDHAVVIRSLISEKLKFWKAEVSNNSLELVRQPFSIHVTLQKNVCDGMLHNLW